MVASHARLAFAAAIASSRVRARVRVCAHARVQGGESEALARLERSFADPKWVAAFQKPDTDPSAFDPSAIFQLTLRQPERAVTLLLFYRLSTAP